MSQQLNRPKRKSTADSISRITSSEPAYPFHVVLRTRLNYYFEIIDNRWFCLFLVGIYIY